MRETLRNYMRSEYDRTGKLEWTLRELLDGLNGFTHNSFTRQQVSNGLQAAKSAGIAEQTRNIPSGHGGAKYWALTKCLELATQPSTQPAESQPTPQEETRVSNDRKPRHDDPEYITHEINRQLTAFKEGLSKDLSVMLGDTEKALKSAITSSHFLTGDGESAPTAITEEKLAKLLKTDRQEMYEDAVRRVTANDVMSFADIGAKLAEEQTRHLDSVIQVARDFLSAYDGTTKMMHDVLRKAVDEDELKEQGFTKGFMAGFAAATKQLRSEISELMKSDTLPGARTEQFGILVERPTGNSATPPEHDVHHNVHDIPLSETLKKLSSGGF